MVTLVSRICMKATTMTVKVMAHFWVAETGASGAGGVIAAWPIEYMRRARRMRADQRLRAAIRTVSYRRRTVPPVRSIVSAMA